jgi:hypothetical protein
VGRACSTHVEMRNVCTILVEKLEGKRPLEDLDVDGRILELNLGK